MDISLQQKTVKHTKPQKLGFEELYIAVRGHENKIYTDAQLQILPDFDTYSREWEIRSRSSSRLLTYLRRKKKSLRILEVGCGNGWLSAKLADIPNSYVTGLDINREEITQASRVFKKANLDFIHDSFNDNTFDKEKFDVVVFAASLQYFPSVVAVLRQAENFLKSGGEIHIIDTPFYDPVGAAKAAERCIDYYRAMGVPQMASHYFHHSISEFRGFKFRVLFNPTNLLNRLFKKDPFNWIAISK